VLYLGDCKVLILDEATSCLNPSMEERIMAALTAKHAHATVLVVTHRVRRALSMDKVLVLDKGRAKEFDCPKRLAADPKSLFREMLASEEAERDV